MKFIKLLFKSKSFSSYFPVIILLFLFSCKKEIQYIKENAKTLDESKVYKRPTTEKEKLLVENLGKITDIFKELYKNEFNIKLVNSAIYSRAYTDESVLLKDLIYPTEGILTHNKKFNVLTSKWGVSLNAFAKSFWIEVKNKNDRSLEYFLDRLVNDNTSLLSASSTEYDPDQVSVYFPYSEEFANPNDGYYSPITSIVTATADADEGWGYLPFYDSNGLLQYYLQVLVNDEYALANPTHIIGLNGIEPEPVPFEAPPLPTATTASSKVFVGELVSKIFYDRLISFTGNGGGNDIRVGRINGYLAPVNGQITSFSNDVISVHVSRFDILFKNWKTVMSIWDNNWVSQNLEQVFAVYEEDNINTKTFNGSINTNLSNTGGNSGNSTITGNIGFAVTIPSQDEIIRQLKITRNTYFISAFEDQGHGFSPNDKFLQLPFTHGWPTYDVNYYTKAGADFGWIMPYKLY
jgi:hypothetical protein